MPGTIVGTGVPYTAGPLALWGSQIMKQAVIQYVGQCVVVEIEASVGGTPCPYITCISSSGRLRRCCHRLHFTDEQTGALELLLLAKGERCPVFQSVHHPSLPMI